MLRPPLLVLFPKIALESLLAPRAIDRVRDRRKRRYRLVHAWILQKL